VHAWRDLPAVGFASALTENRPRPSGGATDPGGGRAVIAPLWPVPCGLIGPLPAWPGQRMAPLCPATQPPGRSSPCVGLQTFQPEAAIIGTVGPLPVSAYGRQRAAGERLTGCASRLNGGQGRALPRILRPLRQVTPSARPSRIEAPFQTATELEIALAESGQQPQRFVWACVGRLRRPGEGRHRGPLRRRSPQDAFLNASAAGPSPTASSLLTASTRSTRLRSGYRYETGAESLDFCGAQAPNGCRLHGLA